MLSKQELVKRLHKLAKKRVVLFRAMRLRRLMQRLQALEVKPCACCK